MDLRAAPPFRARRNVLPRLLLPTLLLPLQSPTLAASNPPETLAHWTPTFPGPSETASVGTWITSIAQGAGTFVALTSERPARLLRSQGGLLWESNPLRSGEIPHGITWTGTRFIIVGKIESSALMLASPDGVAWERLPLPTTLGNATLSQVREDHGILVAQGWINYSLRTAGTFTLASSNGGPWQVHTEPVPASGDSAGHTQLTAGNGRFARIAWTFMPSAGWPEFSTNGLNWQAAPRPPELFAAITFGNGLFLGLRIDGRIMASPDAVTWTDHAPSPAPANPHQTVRHAGGVFFMHHGTSLSVSTDGVAWSTRPFPSDLLVLDVAGSANPPYWCTVGERVSQAGDHPALTAPGPFIALAGLPQPLETRIGIPIRSPQGTPTHIAAQAAPGPSLSLEATEDLLQWRSVAIAPNPTGRVDFELPPSATPARLLRVRKATGP